MKPNTAPATADDLGFQVRMPFRLAEEHLQQMLELAQSGSVPFVADHDDADLLPVALRQGVHGPGEDCVEQGRQFGNASRVDAAPQVGEMPEDYATSRSG